MLRRFCPFLLLFFALACTNADKKAEPQPAPQYIYADYRIWGDEEGQRVTTLIQFFESADKQEARLLAEPALVELDGQPLQPDSAQLSGTYYEAQHPLSNFSGKHTITFYNSAGKKISENFSFVVFRLRNELPMDVPRQELVLELEGLPQEDVLRVVLTDTSFTSKGINRLDTVRDGRLVLRKADLNRLKSGPVILQLFREEDRPLRTNLPGEISVSYGLTRDFFLVD